MTTKKRIQWIDIAKGISIILVVYGHSGLNNDTYHRFMVTCLSEAVFFFVSWDYCFLEQNTTPLSHSYENE